MNPTPLAPVPEPLLFPSARSSEDLLRLWSAGGGGGATFDAGEHTLETSASAWQFSAPSWIPPLPAGESAQQWAVAPAVPQFMMRPAAVAVAPTVLAGVPTAPFSPPALQPARPTSLSQAIMMDLRPIVAANSGAAAAARAHLPPPSAAPLAAAHAGLAPDDSSPAHARTASAKAVAAAETARLLGESQGGAAAVAAPAPTAGTPGGRVTSPQRSQPRKRTRAAASNGPGATGTTGATGDSVQGGSGSDSDEQEDQEGRGDHQDPRRCVSLSHRRMLSNRESARRSRRRKVERLEELQERLNEALAQRDAARQHNEALRRALLAAGLPLPAGEPAGIAPMGGVAAFQQGQVEPPAAAAAEAEVQVEAFLASEPPAAPPAQEKAELAVAIAAAAPEPVEEQAHPKPEPARTVVRTRAASATATKEANKKPGRRAIRSAAAKDA